MKLKEAIQVFKVRAEAAPAIRAKEHAQIAKWLEELVRLREEEKRFNAGEDSNSFFRLIYRTELGFLLQRLGTELALKRMRKRCSGHSLTVKDLHLILRHLVTRAEDDTRCNDICKGMYFCLLEKGHKGEHQYW